MTNIEIQLADSTNGTWIRTDSLETIATGIRDNEMILGIAHARAALDICDDLANAMIAWMDREDLCCDLWVQVTLPSGERLGAFTIVDGAIGVAFATR